MKKTASVLALAFVFTLACVSFAGIHDGHNMMHGMMHDGPSTACKICGMDIEMAPNSKIVITYEDGSAVHVCSLRCAAVEMAENADLVPESIMVGEYNTKSLINAETAVWVIGGKVQGVMSIRAKWAFQDRKSAEEFVLRNGGDITSFEEALKAAYDDIYKDGRTARDKRHSMKGMQH